MEVTNKFRILLYTSFDRDRWADSEYAYFSDSLIECSVRKYKSTQKFQNNLARNMTENELKNSIDVSSKFCFFWNQGIQTEYYVVILDSFEYFTN